VKTVDKSTSESERDIVEQPEPTCPLIDEALKEVDLANRKIRRNGREDESELREMLDDVETCLASLSGYRKSGLLEDIRTRTQEIRHWGEQWKRYALYLEDNTPTPATPTTPTTD
jgi:hypothetical protein